MYAWFLALYPANAIILVKFLVFAGAIVIDFPARFDTSNTICTDNTSSNLDVYRNMCCGRQGLAGTRAASRPCRLGVCLDAAILTL
jgi:hypothetical protein